MGGDALQRLLYLLMMQTAMILLMSEGIPRGLSFLLFAGSFKGNKVCSSEKLTDGR